MNQSVADCPRLSSVQCFYSHLASTKPCYNCPSMFCPEELSPACSSSSIENKSCLFGGRDSVSCNYTADVVTAVSQLNVAQLFPSRPLSVPEQNPRGLVQQGFHRPDVLTAIH